MDTNQTLSPKFDLGQTVMTHSVSSLEIDQAALQRVLFLHSSGIWGEVPPEDKEANNEALKTGGRLISSYIVKESVKVWVITEADRSATTILLPSDY